MAETVDLGELIGRVVSLCEGAADLIREAYHGGGDLQTRFKDGVSDPVTIADLRAQHAALPADAGADIGAHCDWRANEVRRMNHFVTHKSKRSTL